MQIRVFVPSSHLFGNTIAEGVSTPFNLACYLLSLNTDIHCRREKKRRDVIQIRELVRAKRLATVFVVLLLFSSMTATVFASSSSKTVTSADSMSLYLPANATGDSSVISFNLSGLPANAVVTKVVVDGNGGVSSGGMGAIVSTKVWVKNSKMDNYASAPWERGNKTTISTGLIGKPAVGIWNVYYTGTNVSSYNDASKTYKYVKLTVYYNY